MGQPYVGEIRIFAGNFAPAGWMFCSGQLLPISQYDTLFNLIGTTYGGDGQNTFALPDLRGRIPLHFGNNGGNSFVQGQSAGVESVTLTTQQIPGHSHACLVNGNQAATNFPNGNFLAAGPTMYIVDSQSATMSPLSVSSVGGSQPHNNFQPYLCVNFIISLFGIFPSAT